MRLPYASLGRAAWILASFAATACGEDAAEESGDYYQAALSSPRYALPGAIVDHRGRRWNCPKKATYSVVTSIPEPRWEEPRQAAVPPRDRVQLARALRSVTDVNCYRASKSAGI